MFLLHLGQHLRSESGDFSPQQEQAKTSLSKTDSGSGFPGMYSELSFKSEAGRDDPDEPLSNCLYILQIMFV